MVTVFGSDWCEDTQRSLRRLRRLGVRHMYLNIDADSDALEQAKALNDGKRRTPTIELDGEVLIEPSNEFLTNALIRHAEITDDEIREKQHVQNVGDLERALRVTTGLLALMLSRGAGRSARGPLAVLGFLGVVTGMAGWCPAYTAAGVSSLDGPVNRPREAERAEFLTRVV